MVSMVTQIYTPAEYGQYLAQVYTPAVQEDSFKSSINSVTYQNFFCEFGQGKVC